MRLAISSDGKTFEDTQIIPTPISFEDGIEEIKRYVNTIKRSDRQGVKFKAAAGGVAAPLDREKTKLVHAPNIPDWINRPLKKELEDTLGIPVILENDAAIVGLGEATSGAGIGKEIVVYITVSTGVGGARIVNGKVDNSALGFEPGHQIIVLNGRKCSCGGKGHLEAYISGLSLEREYSMKPEEIINPEVWDESARILAAGLYNLIVTWSPDIIVIGGSVSKRIELELVKKYLEIELKIFAKTPEITRAMLGDTGGLYGALKLLSLQKD